MTSSTYSVVLLSLLTAFGCGSDGDGAVPDAQRGIDASSGIDAAGIDAAGTDAAVADANPTQVDANTETDAAASTVVINEIVLDQYGNDSDEFAELKGTPNTDYSNLLLLQIDGDDDGTNQTDPGKILSTHPGCTTDSLGYCSIEVASHTFQNGTQTLLLVSGTVGKVDVDTNDDGVFDSEPWTAILDAVAIYDNRPSENNIDQTYSGNAVLTKVLNGAGDEPLVFGGGSRIPDGLDTNEASDWTSNAPRFDNTNIQTGEARNTPGAVNSVE